MFEIDKVRFGAFVASLRKEKGYTQKELAQRLFLSDKAVSKWETGASMPDITLLIPLAEVLDVTVTELLECRRVKETAMEPEQVEQLVQKTIRLTGESRDRTGWGRGGYAAVFLAAVALMAVELLLFHPLDILGTGIWTVVLLSTGFGAYFWLFPRDRLPDYYDQSRIGMYNHGVVRMNIPGVALNNSNWPKIVWVLRIWCVAAVILFPLLSFAWSRLLPARWPMPGEQILTGLWAAILVISLYVTGKRYE